MDPNHLLEIQQRLQHDPYDPTAAHFAQFRKNLAQQQMKQFQKSSIPGSQTRPPSRISKTHGQGRPSSGLSGGRLPISSVSVELPNSQRNLVEENRRLPGNDDFADETFIQETPTSQWSDDQYFDQTNDGQSFGGTNNGQSSAIINDDVWVFPMIEAMESHPVIWSKQHPEHSIRLKVQNAWDLIAAKVEQASGLAISGEPIGLLFRLSHRFFKIFYYRYDLEKAVGLNPGCEE